MWRDGNDNAGGVGKHEPQHSHIECLLSLLLIINWGCFNVKGW